MADWSKCPRSRNLVPVRPICISASAVLNDSVYEFDRHIAGDYMCRLYGFHSTVPRKVECELIESQNSLIRQSANDEHGTDHPHGWGLVTYYDEEAHADRQLEPAYKSEKFRWAAGQAYSRTILAHVRRATVGPVTLENTHPFVTGHHSFVHNGTIEAFPLIRQRMIEAMGKELAGRIRGTTDSEHVFLLALSRLGENSKPMTEALAETRDLVRDWAREANPDAEFALNVIWTNGASMVGSRLGRSLWYTPRDHAHICEICGTNHTRAAEDEPYNAVVLASEKLTRTEEWTSIAEGSIFEVREDCEITVTS